MATQDQLPRRRNDSYPTSVHQAMGEIYDYVPSFVLADGVSEYDLKAQQAAAFKNIKNAHYFELHTDQDIYVKFNDTSMPDILVEAFCSPYVFKDVLRIMEAYLTNSSGSNANIKVMML